jgi:signal transduction histidine kinase
VAAAVVVPAPAVTCHGDPRRLQQILLNLLLNARDAMPDGGAVTVSVASNGDVHSVTVLDQGAGLGDTPVQKLFEPFWTSKTQGSGLGLAVSRQIAREHGGDLTLADRRDAAGCAAVLTLPADRDRAPDPEA